MSMTGTGSESIRRQIVLPWNTSVAIAVNNLRLRFFRSLVTALSLVLAIAFLAYTLAGSAIADELFRLHGDAAARLLTSAGYTVGPTGLTTGPKDIWLMALSLLVCTVGIVNAQLMSVTERFREIGIMKCLGALDIIILRLFVLEALIMGTVGAGAGALAGVLIAYVGALLQYAPLDFSGMLVAPLALAAGKAWAAGIGLALLGVLYPALLAARLHPIVVMREEH